MKQDYNRAMDQLHLPPQAEQRILTALESRAKQPKKRNWRIGAALAAAAVLMTGSAFAVAYRWGVLEAFFHGDTSQVEPYVQTAVGSAENQDYRLTVDSTVCDSQTLYAVITVEGLNDQAVEDLKSNKVIAESHREVWGTGDGGFFDGQWLRRSRHLLGRLCGQWNPCFRYPISWAHCPIGYQPFLAGEDLPHGCRLPDGHRPGSFLVRLYGQRIRG